MKFVSPKVWLVGLPCVCAFALHRSHSTGAAAVSFSKCMDDLESCASGVEQMVETACTKTLEVHHELNATRKRFDKILKEFVGCNSLMSQVLLQIEFCDKSEKSHAVQTDSRKPTTMSR